MRPTEAFNPLSENIDIADSAEIVDILQSVDSEIIKGWEGFPSFESKEVVRSLTRMAETFADAIFRGDKVVLGGCGTSGRLAFFCTRIFNKILRCEFSKEACFEYLMAGGDAALFVSQELAEDQPALGASDLDAALQRHKKNKANGKAVFVGITCGLSAPYVKGQLEKALEEDDYSSVILIGHNPCELARPNFIDIARKVKESKKGIVVTPVMGGETISGSSRMKGGSGTLISLHSAFLAALAATFDEIQLTESVLEEILGSFGKAISDIYEKNKSNLANLIDAFGKTLKSDACVRYLAEDEFGVLGLIDASECPPTYGSSFDDVRGFIHNGWDVMDNRENLESFAKDKDETKISFNDCSERSQSDTNLHVIINFSESDNFAKSTAELRRKLAGRFITITSENSSTAERDSTSLSFELFSQADAQLTELKGASSIAKLLQQFVQHLQFKLILNAASTGGHVLKGKVAKNRMIDVKVSNSKLLERGTGIVETFACCSKDVAFRSILKVIHGIDELSDTILNREETFHIKKATPMNNIIPRAILLSSNRAQTVTEATLILKENPVIRNAIIKD